MNKNEIIEYLKTTPNNTNFRIVSNMLDRLIDTEKQEMQNLLEPIFTNKTLDNLDKVPLENQFIFCKNPGTMWTLDEESEEFAEWDNIYIKVTDKEFLLNNGVEIFDYILHGKAHGFSFAYEDNTVPIGIIISTKEIGHCYNSIIGLNDTEYFSNFYASIENFKFLTHNDNNNNNIYGTIIFDNWINNTSFIYSPIQLSNCILYQITTNNITHKNIGLLHSGWTKISGNNIENIGEIEFLPILLESDNIEKCRIFGSVLDVLDSTKPICVGYQIKLYEASDKMDLYYYKNNNYIKIAEGKWVYDNVTNTIIRG